MLRAGERGYLSNNVPFEGETDSSDSESELDGSPKRKRLCRSKAQCNMVMVDQLWLWILGGKVLRSPYPNGMATQLTRAKILS